MNDGIREIGKYIKNLGKSSDYAIKRTFQREPTQERIRDVFDPTYPFKGVINKPEKAERVTMSVNFGKSLPLIGCCADCLCGTTESYSSDALVNSAIYLVHPYQPNSTVVYLNGVRAVRNTDYVESDPANKQITILIPFTAIVISYTYSEGNCTDNLCLDTTNLVCLPDSYYSGNVIVFADRFDRPESTVTSGGCGRWVTGSYPNYVTQYLGNRGSGGLINPGNYTALLGGPFGACIGKSWEVVTKFSGNLTGVNLGIRMDTKAASTQLTFNRISVDSTTSTYSITLGGSIFVWNNYTYGSGGTISANNPRESEFFTKTFSQIAFDRTKDYYLRYIQMTNGWAFKIWDADEAEETGILSFQNQMTSADFPNDLNHWDNIDEVVLITPYAMNLNLPIYAVKVTGGTDTGVYDTSGNYSGETSYKGHFCNSWDGITRNVPPDAGYCSPPTNTVTNTQAFWPSAGMVFDFPFPFVPPSDDGRLQNYDETIGHITCTAGFPSHIRIQGYITATVYLSGISIPVQIISYGDLRAGAPAFNGPSGFGGSIVASYTVDVGGPHQVLVPIDVLLPVVNGHVFWGVRIPSSDAVADGLPYKGSSFPFLAPQHGIEISFEECKIKAVSMLYCSATDYCENGCGDARCPNTADGFNGTSTGFATSSISYEVGIDAGLPVVIDQEAGSRITYSGGVASIDFNATNSSVQFNYAGPYGCFGNAATSEIGEARFDFQIPSSALDTSGGGLYFYSEAGSYSVFYDVWDSAIHPSGPGPVAPPNISANTWYSVVHQIESTPDTSTTYRLKVWPSGTAEPTSWDVEYTDSSTQYGSNFVIVIYNNSTTAFNAKIRNLTVKNPNNDLVVNIGPHGEPISPEIPPVLIVDNTITAFSYQYPYLEDAIKLVPDGGTILLQGIDHTVWDIADTGGYHINKSMTIKKHPSTEAVRITSSSNSRPLLFTVEAGPVTFQDITFQANIYPLYYYPSYNGEGLVRVVSGSHDVTFNNCTFVGNGFMDTGWPSLVLAQTTGDITVTNCTFNANVSNPAISFTGNPGGSNFTITNNTFFNNFNGIYIDQTADGIFIDGNTITYSGDSAITYGSSDGAIIQNNSGNNNNAGLVIINGANLTQSNNNF